MAIRVDSLRKIRAKELKSFTYSDIHLDLEKNSVAGVEFQKQEEKSDLRADFDLGAIKNSIRNLFRTKPGQKILNPTFGLDFEQFLFLPVTEATANDIGQTILRGITIFEPRVKLININVIAIPEQNQYTVDLSFSVPQISNNPTSLNGTLSESGISI